MPPLRKHAWDPTVLHGFGRLDLLLVNTSVSIISWQPQVIQNVQCSPLKHISMNHEIPKEDFGHG